MIFGDNTMSPDVYFFFFQAEDGIRDLTVTGVQTCALPISSCTGTARIPGRRERIHEALRARRVRGATCLRGRRAAAARERRGRARRVLAASRSEERRVGKECRSRGSPYH